MRSKTHTHRNHTGPSRGNESPVDDRHPYEIAYEVLKQHLDQRKLPRGLVLLEGPVADLLAMSRAPVRRALELLCQDGMIRRFAGRGYLVGKQGDSSPPLRLPLREAGFTPPEGLRTSLGLFTWERIYQEIEATVARTIPFGTYRIVESAVTERFGVSRTVAREVLSRLRDRGLIEKNRWSTWIAGPLTAHTVEECFDIRMLLEPSALRECAPAFDSIALGLMHARLVAAETTDPLSRNDVDRLEHDLHHMLIGRSRNRRLLAIVRECQMPMVINQLFDEHFGPVDHRAMLTEHRLVIDHLRLGLIDAAAAALAAHLDAARQRTKARLKVLAIIPDPKTEAYLERIH